MSKTGTISRLEALLARIRSRASEPRSELRSVAAIVPPPVAHVPPPAVTPPPAVVAPVLSASPAPPPVAARPAFTPPAAPVASPRLAPAPSPEPPQVVVVEEKSVPPAARLSSVPPADLDFDVDVDVSRTTPPPAPTAPSEPPPARAPLESRERISEAAPPMEPQVAEPVAARGPDESGPSIEQVEVLGEQEEDAAIAGDEDEELEEAPASSRRPVAPAETRLADLAFGTEEPQPPRHTPPPKSGRLPAPPAVDFDADVTGVRPAVTPEAARPAVEDEATQVSAQASVLTPQAARPNLAVPADAKVIDVVGEAQRFTPATFMALLDASLSL